MKKLIILAVAGLLSYTAFGHGSDARRDRSRHAHAQSFREHRGHEKAARYHRGGESHHRGQGHCGGGHRHRAK